MWENGHEKEIYHEEKQKKKGKEEGEGEKKSPRPPMASTEHTLLLYAGTGDRGVEAGWARYLEDM